MKRFPSPGARAISIALLLAGVLGCPKPRPAPEPDGFVIPVNEPAPAPTADEMVVRGRTVKLDLPRLTDTVELPFTAFDDVRLRLVRDRVERMSAKAFVWFGHVERQPGSSAIFAVQGEAVAGTVRTVSGKLYRIRYTGRGVHRIEEIDGSKFPPEGEPSPPVSGASPAEADTCSTDSGNDIDILVLYTATTRAAAGGTDPMEATVFLAIAETNQSYINSNINQRLRLAHVEEVTYTESGTSMTDRDRLQNTSDGILDNALTLRNTFAADAVILVVESLENCGRAFIMTTVANSFETSAYGVVRRSCATGNFSFGHELGHIMGARHDWTADSNNNSPHAFNHGHCVPAPTATGVGPWRTIMSTTNSSTRIQNWSNPNVNFPPGVTPTDATGTATGAQQTDNAQTLNLTALTVANFRCSSPGVANVWMKDTWNDTGKEPDPATAAEDMWRSPYIWARTSQDAGLVNQHMHQNPEVGASNFLYVKLHNGNTTAQSGNLELYFANASASLDWPAAWTLIGTTAVNGFAAGSTRIVEQAWTTVPGVGHYCLLARWVSASDPMAAAEGTDINANVRGNNNLAWRNMNVVDLVADESADASFGVSNRSERRKVASLWIRGPRGIRQPSFLDHGEVFVALDEKLSNAWRQGGGKGSGFGTEKLGMRIAREGARFDNLILPPGFEGRVTVRFRRLPTTPRRDFGLDVEYLADGKTAGGVAYEVHTDRSVR
jgi:hypothetical protein